MSILADLARMPGELEDALELFSAESLDWRPAAWHDSPAERFSAIEHICHVRDIEIDGYHVRFARLLEEEAPDLVSIDGYALAAERLYEAQSPEKALREFRVARAKTISLLVDSWGRRTRRGTFAEFGDVTFESLAHILRSHDLQHLAGLQWLHAKFIAARD